ncbi:hypothetical protein HJFPF1_11307 [Paramyrothecium foliicola]|nr:hypothetical protein HJFPF1_11307 [Paramyrothecium foliicola]
MDSHDVPVPQLPVKSSRRMTSLLANLPHKIDSEEQPALSQATPHDHYLSSEEDASSSADDLSDYSFDTEDEDLSPLSTELPAPQQITARAVSVVFSGKPCIVDLPRRSTSPSSSRPTSRSTDITPAQRRTPAANASFAKRMSIMSFRSATIANSRPSSVMLDVSDAQQRPRRPNFLDSDPFPSSEEPLSSRKTPGTMLKRTLNLVKKRSRPQLSQSSSASFSRDDLSLPEQLDGHPFKPLQHASTAPMSPSSPSKLRAVREGLSLTLPRSIRA